jgi:transposase
VSHRNARTTLHGRLLIVQRHQQGWKQAHIAAAMGVSRKCVHTWVSRYAAEGEAGLQDRSSQPHRCPMRTPARVERQVIAARRKHRHGQDWLGRSWVSPRAPLGGFCVVVVRPTCVTAIR